jgi:tRNA threonylcarbamoyladenosine biosynthesis protein TsaB
VRLLAIETATLACSVALIDNGAVIDATHKIVGRGHAEQLLPMIAALTGGGKADAILVDIGPGSFTGIRVGIAAARGLGFGWNVPVTGYHSLALIASIDGCRGDSVVAIEGGHGELFIGRYASMPMVETEPPRSVPFDVAVCTLTNHRIVGNAAHRLIEARGFGEAVDVSPDARAASRLPTALASAQPTPFYGRGADARPMAKQ